MKIPCYLLHLLATKIKLGKREILGNVCNKLRSTSYITSFYYYQNSFIQYLWNAKSQGKHYRKQEEIHDLQVHQYPCDYGLVSSPFSPPVTW